MFTIGDSARLAGVTVRMLRHYDSMATIGDTWQALATTVDGQGLTAYGPCREVYLETPMGDQDAWVTELQQPVR